MYAHLTGTIADIGTDHAVVSCGGVGYLVFCPTRSLGALQQGKESTLYTYLAVREDALTMFGFTEKSEKAIFQLLLTVSGVGPKMALSILSTLSGAEAMQAVHTNQPTVLARASGVGKKLAEKIIVELRDKALKAMPATSSLPNTVAAHPTYTDLMSALVNLGFQPKQAETAAHSTLTETPDAPFEELFRTALKKVA